MSFYYLTIEKDLASETQKYHEYFSQSLCYASLSVFHSIILLAKFSTNVGKERIVIQASIFPCNVSRRKGNLLPQHLDIKSIRTSSESLL